LRKILKVDESNFVLKDVCKLMASYIKNNNIKDVSELKSNLYKITFQNIDSDSFELFYYSSDSIVWEINDKKMLK
jgi:prophage antirepressor-like protein